MDRIYCALSLILLLFSLSVHCNPATLIRRTLNGPVEGVERVSSLGQKYYAFEGIPYAAPPITGMDPYTGKQVDRRFKVNSLKSSLAEWRSETALF